MARTPSNMIALDTKAPDFALFDTLSQKTLALEKLKSPLATVIMFLCNHCPYVIHIKPTLLNLAKKYQQQGVSFIAISANDAEKYPADGPDAMHEEATKENYPFPYLYDADQSVAKAYNAACTPDFYIFDKDLRCCYRGRFDAATPGNQTPVTGAELSAALDAILQDKTVDPNQLPSIGCNIKWK